MRRAGGRRVAAALLFALLLLFAPVADSAKKKKPKKAKRAHPPPPAERPDGIDAGQWEQLDEEERGKVAAQIEAMKPPPIPELVAPEDDSVAWEEWDGEKYDSAWASLGAIVAEQGGGEPELKAAVASLLARGWRPVHAAAQHGQLQQLEVMLEFLEPLVERAELLRDRQGVSSF